jgi:hypothetical protein
MEQERKNLDLSALSFHEFVAFFFDREVVSDEKQREYFRADSSGEKCDRFEPSSSERLVDHLTNLMLEFGTIASMYDPAQVDQAMWGMWSGQSLDRFLWDRTVPLDSRVRCVSCPALPGADAAKVSLLSYELFPVLLPAEFVFSFQNPPKTMISEATPAAAAQDSL